MEEQDKPVLSSDRDSDWGRVATKTMFKQYCKGAKEDIEDWRKRFVSTLDPTEYAGAIELLGSWEEWLRFKRNWPSFQKLHLDDWMEEIEIKIKSMAIRALIMQSQGDSGASAAKFLVEAKHHEKKVGRPSKEIIERQLRIDTAAHKEVANDLERIKDFR